MALTRSFAFLLAATAAVTAGSGVAASLGGNLVTAPDILLFVGLPTFAPLAILAVPPVRKLIPWITILTILVAAWGWVMFEYGRPYQGGGVNFAALSGAGISILACIPALAFAALSGRRCP